MQKVQTKLWSVDEQPAGTWVSSRNLTYAKVRVAASHVSAMCAYPTFYQIFNASHMAPYDVPMVAHDMILRFVNMNFSAIVDGSALIPSSIGDESKPVFFESPPPTQTPEKTPDEVKAQWEGEKSLIQVAVASTKWSSSVLQCWFRRPGPASYCHRNWTLHMVPSSETTCPVLAGSLGRNIRRKYPS